MSLDAIKAQLNSEFLAITGVQTAPSDLPDTPPISPDNPSILLDYQEEFLTTESVLNDRIRYTWHFLGKFLYKPIGEGAEDEEDAELEPFMKRIADKLYSTLSGNANWTLIGNLIRWTRGPVDYEGEWFRGFTFAFDIYEDVTTAFGV
ncbi:MAG TPA: hypothetical protein VFD70_18640 [Anaerolineae bacterium]|nr:hypothetical protein [Anaerolineae bacterium]